MDLVDELLAEVKAARRAQSAATKHTDRVKELLVQIRIEEPKLSVVELEQKIGRFYDRATISRITAGAVKQASKPAES